MNESEVIENTYTKRATHMQIKLNDKMDDWNKREKNKIM